MTQPGTAVPRIRDRLCDRDIRTHLLAHLRTLHPTDTAIIEELGLCHGDARAGIAVVNGVLHGFEIKSERDSLERLAHQVDAYGRAFGYATLVTCEKHLAEARARVPRWWGIIC